MLKYLMPNTSEFANLKFLVLSFWQTGPLPIFPQLWSPKMLTRLPLAVVIAPVVHCDCLPFPFFAAFQEKELFGFSNCYEETVTPLNPKSGLKQQTGAFTEQRKCVLIKIILKNKVVREPKFPNLTRLLVQLCYTRRHLKPYMCPFYTKMCRCFSSFLVTLTARIVKCSVGVEVEAFPSPFT